EPEPILPELHRYVDPEAHADKLLCGEVGGRFVPCHLESTARGDRRGDAMEIPASARVDGRPVTEESSWRLAKTLPPGSPPRARGSLRRSSVRTSSDIAG